MAYNVSYSTLPTFTSDSIGYTQPAISYNGGSGWFYPDVISLNPGIYSISSNMSFQDSPNSFGYIVYDISTNPVSIWFDSSPVKYYQMSQYSGSPSFQPDLPTGVPFTSYYPIAGQQMRNGDAGKSSALSLSTTLSASNTFNLTAIGYSQSSGNNCITLMVTRIS